jgi:hypothetical protein
MRKLRLDTAKIAELSRTHSLRQIAAVMNCSKDVIAIVLKKKELRTPEKIAPRIKAAIISALQRGVPSGRIARVCGVGISTIYRYKESIIDR